MGDAQVTTSAEFSARKAIAQCQELQSDLDVIRQIIRRHEREIVNLRDALKGQQRVLKALEPIVLRLLRSWGK
jgi:cob(I)alamin adenosyltransferase